MSKDLQDKLKLIDIEIANAINAISEIEKDLKDVKTDDIDKIPQDQRLSIRDKFESFNKSFNQMLDMLVESGVLTEEDLEK